VGRRYGRTARYGPPPVASAEGGPQAGEGSIARHGGIRRARQFLVSIFEFLLFTPLAVRG